MEFFVCIKQVPSTNKVQMDERTGVLKREGITTKMNPFDLFALEAALRLRELHGGHLSVGTMGPPQAEAVLREAYLMGADDGFLFSDRRFGGADVLATSYTLAQGIRCAGDFDIIFCGRQTTDGDTAQVGPAIAEHLGIPHAAWVSGIEIMDGGAVVRQQLQDVVETVFMPFPCLVTVEQDLYSPRLPSLARRKLVKDKPVTVIGLDMMLDRDPRHYGLDGSPTRVENIFPPPGGKARETVTGPDCAEQLHNLLKQWKFV